MITRLKQRIIDRLGITRLAETAIGAEAAVQESERRRAELGARVDDLERSLHGERDRLDTALADHAQRLRIAEHTLWSATAPLRHEPTIGIVLATRDRAPLLPAAIDSVRAQTYPRWHLVVVDDGSADDTPALLRAIADDDERVTVERTDGVGAAAARNAGLDRVTGEFVAFLDDDNALHPGWLRAIAEYTGRVANTDALFGAQLREDPLGDTPVPRMWFTPTITVEDLRRDNAIDLGALAVRRDHPELRFDASLDRYIDWEMIVRIAATTGIDPLPVVSSCYTLRAAGSRISDLDDGRLDAMRERLAGAPERDGA
jgi:hypothetical protein